MPFGCACLEQGTQPPLIYNGQKASKEDDQNQVRGRLIRFQEEEKGQHENWYRYGEVYKNLE